MATHWITAIRSSWPNPEEVGGGSWASLDSAAMTETKAWQTWQPTWHDMGRVGLIHYCRAEAALDRGLEDEPVRVPRWHLARLSNVARSTEMVVPPKEATHLDGQPWRASSEEREEAVQEYQSALQRGRETGIEERRCLGVLFRRKKKGDLVCK